MPIRSIEKRTVFLLLALLTGSFFVSTLQTSLSLLFGGVIALVNFRFLAKGVQGWVSQASGQKGAFSALIFILKYPLLLALIGFVVLKMPVRVEAFVAGFLCLVFAIVLEGIFPTKAKAALMNS